MYISSSFIHLCIDKIFLVCYNDNTDGTDCSQFGKEANMSRFTFSKRDIYLEIAERYEKYITLGILKSQDKLPSVRVAAAELHVNPTTVQRAYSLLEEKGLIRSMPKKGAFVIYTNEKSTDGKIFDALTSELIQLNSQGVSKEKIISIIEEVYKE